MAGEWTPERSALQHTENLKRLDEWTAVLTNLVNTYDDEGIAVWIAHHKGDREAMLRTSAELDGMIAT